MSFSGVMEQFLQLAAGLDPRTAAFLFVICAIGEFGPGIPYVLESIWLLVGYQLGTGALSPVNAFGLWLAAQGGRQVGSLLLYYAAGLGRTPLDKLYQKYRNSRFWPKVNLNHKGVSRLNFTSPFSVAYWRLFGLRIPLTIALAARRKMGALLTGVLLCSVVWDGVYIILGITVGRTAVLKPVQMFLASLAGLTVLYLVVMLVRRLWRRPQLESS